MNKGLTKIILAILLLLPLCANATPIDVNIYSDETIEDGDVYGTVNIYDTPPDQTTVTMTGGDIEYCNIYDTANLNFSGGEILLVATYNNSKATINASTAGGGFELYDYSQVHLYDAGNFTNVQIFDNAELHVYGYDFSYDPSTTGTREIYGTWENGQSFKIALRQPSDYDPYTQVILHEIPEPSTISILGLLVLLVRKRGDRFLSRVKNP